MKRLLLLFVVTALADAGTVTFEGFPGASGNPSLSTPTNIQGLTFNSSHFHVIGDLGCSFGGCVSPATYLGVDGPALGQPVTITLTGGGVFSLLSLDSSMLWNNSVDAAAGGFPNGEHVNLLGNLSGGGTLSTSFTLGVGFATHTLSGWDSLSSVVLSASVTGGTADASFAADNIVFQPGAAVPEPASLVLMGAGLCLLAAWRRVKCDSGQ